MGVFLRVRVSTGRDDLDESNGTELPKVRYLENGTETSYPFSVGLPVTRNFSDSVNQVWRWQALPRIR
jgi:hypothetical protein